MEDKVIARPRKKPYRPRRQRDRVNDRIRVPKVRVVYGEKQLGVMNTQDAIRLAKERGLDLVEVSATTRPPVCKIIDYGKHKYDQAKLLKAHPKKTHRLKEVKFRVGVAEHDYKIKVTRAESFLMGGDKTRVQLMFRGRQMAHKEIGFELMKKVAEDLVGVGHVDMEPRLSGRFISMMLSPLAEHMRVPKFTGHEEAMDHFDEDDHDEEFDEFEDDHDGDEEGADAVDGEAKPKKKKKKPEEAPPERPHEGHIAEPEDLIAFAEGDTGRPKNKRKN